MEWHYLSIAGLTLIAFGWFYQFGMLSNKGRELTPLLPLASAAGIVLLVLDAFAAGMIDVAMFNALTFIGSALVFMAVYSPSAMKMPAVKMAAKKKRRR
ncbi:Uncharacterised protein [uncultured archaeon]|nr:Uncharacterised protein [uncultured archaeon]